VKQSETRKEICNMATLPKKYSSMKDATNDMQRMARQGWTAGTPVVGSYRKAGCLSWIGFGLFNLFRKSKARDVTVIYTK
jgi:hypothetical protein